MGLMETNNNMKDFNITEILKYAPKGLKLYSPIFGEVRFKEIDDDNCIVVDDKYNNRRWFYEYGTFFPSDEDNFSESECLLFPSINHRCWNHWQNTLFLESIGSVCVDTINGNKFILGEDGTYFSDNTGGYYSVIIENDLGNYLLNSRYATPEETKEFFEELEKRGYKWDGKMVVKKKFKVGDWIVNDYCVGKVIALTDDAYLLDTEQSIPFSYEHNAHLWTIQDAKDGDILTNDNNSIFIFKEEYIAGKPTAYCGIIDGYFFEKVDGCWTNEKCYPATKEQRDFLFQKIYEAGFEWNANTKKLIKTTIPKFKVGDIVKFDRPSATVKREILSIDFENERYLTRRTDIGGAIKEFIYFCEQDDYVIVGSHNSLSNLSIEVKVSALADEINSIKQDIESLKVSRNQARMRIDSLENWAIENGNPDIHEKIANLEKDVKVLTNRLDAIATSLIGITPPLTKDPILYPDKVTCANVFKTSDRAGDCVTLKDMKS